MKLLDFKRDLEWRDLLKDITNEVALENILENSGKFYIGIDPTADSIHIGHFLSLNLARILTEHGLKPLIVIGGFTGMIGDPSGKSNEREVIDKELIKNNVISLTKQIKNIGNKIGLNDLEIFDNNDIYDSITIIDFFQKYGKMFNVNNMLAKESVKNRLKNGISYTEFSYQVFQSLDFLWLFKEKNVQLQLGGSDQWGNITAGIDLIRKIEGSHHNISGITINLLTDEQGNKIGKTQGIPMWLDKEKTSPYSLHQFFVNQTDLMAKKLIVQITNITEEEYNNLYSKSELNPSERIIQKDLSKRFISTIHSVEDFKSAKKLSEILFKEKYNEINHEQIHLLKSAPSFKNNIKIPIMDLLLNNEIITSRREFRELISTGAIKVNGTSIISEDFILKDFVLDKVAFINIGKKNKYIVWK